MRIPAVLLVVGVLALGTACSTGHEDSVRAVAAEFSTAVSDGDWPAACALLAPKTRSSLEQSAGKPCDQALPEEQPIPVGDPERVSVFGTSAQLRYADETIFLARFQEGWRIMAALCTPKEPERFDCTISGG